VTKFGGMGSSITWRIVRSEPETIPIKVARMADGTEEVLTFQVTPVKAETKAWQRKSLRQIRIGPAFTPIVYGVVTNSPAARAGLRKDDEILEFNGKPLVHFAQLDEYASAHPGEPIPVKGLRDGKPFEASLTPEAPVSPPDSMSQLGIAWTGGGHFELIHPGVWEQVTSSVDAMISTFGALFSSKSDIKPQHLSGAVKILNVYYILFDSPDGWRMAIWFSVLLNVNLALLNLLPIPVLDGGHIVLAIIEGLRRRPVSAKVLGSLQTACALLLIGYMLYVTFYDAQELPWKRSREAPPALKFNSQPISERSVASP